LHDQGNPECIGASPLDSKSKRLQLTWMTSYSAPDVARRFRMKYSLLDSWARTGFVPPTVQAGGSGTRRGYSFQDLVALRLAVRLRAAHVSVGVMRALVAHVRARKGLASPGDVRKIVDVLVTTDGTEVWEVAARSLDRVPLARISVLFVVPLAAVAREVAEQIRARGRGVVAVARPTRERLTPTARPRRLGFPVGTRAS
jgi:DNA-binding transcriptional MerR regulator